MSLDIALQYAVSGLDAMQAQLQVASGNIANAQTPGYSEETLPQTSDPATSGGAGVVTGEIQRATDPLLQQAVQGQTTTAGNATTLNGFYQQVEALFGQVGSGTTIADALNNFASAMQTAAATPQDTIAQVSAVNAGQQLAQQLNGLSGNIQGLRQNADQQIGTDVQTANNTLSTIAQPFQRPGSASFRRSASRRRRSRISATSPCRNWRSSSGFRPTRAPVACSTSSRRKASRWSMVRRRNSSPMPRPAPLPRHRCSRR